MGDAHSQHDDTSAAREAVDDAGIIPLADEEPSAQVARAPNRAAPSPVQPTPHRQPPAKWNMPTRGNRGPSGSPSAPTRHSSTCPGCGYELSGLPLASTRCPECGKIIPKGLLRKTDSQAAVLASQAWREPWWYLVPALPIAVVLAMASEGGEVAIFYLVAYIIMLPVLLGTYMLCCWLWLGFDAPWPLVLLRLAAVQAVCDAVYFAALLTGIPVLPLVIGALAFLGMMVKLMEIDFGDAMLVGLVGMLLKGAAAYALLAILT